MSINDFEENEPEIIELDADELPGLAGFIKSKFNDSENGRLSDDQRW